MNTSGNMTQSLHLRAWRQLQLLASNRLFGIVMMVLVLYGALLAVDFDSASSPGNLRNLARRTGYIGIYTIGAGVLIIAGGIDLSVGSVIALSAVSMALLREQEVDPMPAMLIVLAMSLAIGIFHGLLVTKLGLQPFIITLCGWFIYRGLAQVLTRTDKASSRSVGLGNLREQPTVQAWQQFITGELFSVPMSLVILVVVAGLVAVLLHFSVYGRYLYAVGYNEQAAKYAGIATDRYKILAYALCSFLAGLSGVFYLFDVGTAQPSSTGIAFELFAITGAVLGGCSLRGGQGTVAGMVLGASVLPILKNFNILAGIPNELEFTVIGIALLLGTIADEILKRRAAKKG